MYVPLTGFSRISHRCSDGQNLLRFRTEKKDNVAFSAESSVTDSLVSSLTEFLIRLAKVVMLADIALTGKTIALEL